MPRCDFCGKKVALPFRCQYCNRDFCDDHRLPPNHACAGLAEWKKTPAPGVGIRYGSGGATPFGGGLSHRVAGNKPGRKSGGRIPSRKIILAAAAILLILFLLLTVHFFSDPAISRNGENVSNQEITIPGEVLSPSPSPIPSLVKSPSPPSNPTAPVTEWTTISTPATPPMPLIPGNCSDDPYPVSPSSLSSRILELVNQNRVANGLSPLRPDPVLTSLAVNHSEDMAVNGYFSHVDLSGRNPTERGNESGYSCVKNYGTYYTYGIAENLFQNNLYTSISDTNGVYSYAWSSEEAIAQSTVTGWMASPGHRKNILTQTFDREGMGAAISPDNKVLITEDFC